MNRPDLDRVKFGVARGKIRDEGKLARIPMFVLFQKKEQKAKKSEKVSSYKVNV